jgi:hypothetical protein
MASDKEAAQRRVYVLPNELVERIVAYQQEMGLQSEVEAARRLLDDALKSRDDWRSIARRFKDRLKDTKVVADIAKDVLIGHPLVTEVRFHPDAIEFALKSGQRVTIHSMGVVEATDADGDTLQFNLGSGYGNRDLDDEIPF